MNLSNGILQVLKCTNLLLNLDPFTATNYLTPCTPVPSSPEETLPLPCDHNCDL